MKNRVLPVPRRRACTLALSLAASSLAWAQPPTLPETVVTATRIDTRSDELVSEVRVIERAAIEASTARTLPELLAREAGVQFSSNGGLGQFSSVFIRGTQARHTILLVDGVRLGSATAGTPVWETLPVEAIERIEVLKGPASALYGADGVGGVVQVFTRAPKLGFHPYASLAAGSYGHAKASAGASGGEGALSYSFGVQRSVERGFSSANSREPYGSYNADRDPFRQNAANASLRYAINRDWTASASLLYSDAVSHFDDSSPNLNARSVLRASVAQAGLKGRVQPGWQTELRVSQSEDTNNPIEAQYPDAVQTAQTQWTWQNTLDTRLGLVLAGLEQRVQRVNSSVAYDVTKRTIDSGFVGLNGQAGVHSWQLNARRDRNTQFGTSDTGFAGYGLRVATNWRLHGSYGTTFVAPSFNDLYYPYSMGNPNLLPERGRNRDLGLAWGAGGHTLKLVYFDNRISDMIAWSGSAPSNVDRARINGWTLGYEARMERLSLRASLDDMRPRNLVSGTALPRRSDTQATLGASWREGAWLLGTSLLHVGSRFDDTANTRALGAYTVVDVHATWQFAPALSLQAKLNNLTDRVYETTYGYNQSGRALYLTLRWQPK
jgi:vitamin B12 transporter